MSKSKKLLNESTIRRFGGLAGIKPATTSNFLGEMGMGAPAYDRDEEGAEGEMDEMDPVAMDDAEEEPEEPVEDEMELDLEEPAAEADEAEGLVMSLLDKVKEWASANGVDMDVQDDEGEMGGMGEMEDDEVEMELEESDVEAEEQTLEEIISAVLAEEAEEVEEDVVEEAAEAEEDVVEEAAEAEEDVVEEAEETASQDEIIEEVVKRVRQRLVNLAKSEQ